MWKERECYGVLACVLILLVVVLYVLCVHFGVHGKWVANLLPFLKLELKGNHYRQVSASYEFGF